MHAALIDLHKISTQGPTIIRYASGLAPPEPRALGMKTSGAPDWPRMLCTWPTEIEQNDDLEPLSCNIRGRFNLALSNLSVKFLANV